MIIRKLQSRDFFKVQNLIKEQLRVKRKNQVSRLIQYIVSLPLTSAGLDSFIVSVAQTKDGNIIGAIIARRFPFAEIWVIGPLVMNRNYQSLGIGTRIMELMLKLLKDKKAKWAIVIIDNATMHSAARRFLRKFGFKYLNCTFVSRGQAKNHAQMMTLKKLFHSRTEEDLLQKIELKKSSRTWYIMSKKL